MEQKIVFITKSLCYHQIGLADQLFKHFGKSFSFIQVREPLEFRIQAKQEGFERPYLFTYETNGNINETATSILNNADLIIWGEASLRIMKKIKKSAIILKYSERIFKRGYYKFYFLHYILNYINLFRLKFFLRSHQNFLLSAGYYSFKDYKRVGLFKNKAFRWGYFPPLIETDNTPSKFDEDPIKILWVGRLIKWKHPEAAIHAASVLKANNISFEMSIIGDGDEKSGELKNKIAKSISRHKLEKNVKMLGKIEPKAVLELYSKSHIALFTSGPAEGWGVGLNEAMNYRNIVIASDKIGSAPYLVEDGRNGFVYKYYSKRNFENVFLGVAKKIHSLDDVAELAHSTIDGKWSCEEASRRLIKIIENVLNNDSIDIFRDNGPCSIER